MNNQLIQKLHDIHVLKENKCYSGSRKNLEKHPDVKQLLWDLTAFGNESDDYQIRIMYITNNLTELPKCKTCGGPVGPSKVYSQRGTFAEYCSRSCINYTNNIAKSKQTCMEKYGVDNPAKSQAAIEKAKQTNRERYGADYAQQTEEGKKKITQTMQERYGVDRPLQSPEFIQKAVQTNIERYGASNPAQNDDVVAKKKQTCLDRYGVDNVFKLKEVQERILSNNKFKSPEFREKLKKILIEKYGVDNPMKAEEIKQKVDRTNLSKYGYTRAIQDPSLKHRIKQEHTEKYGVDHPSKAHIDDSTVAKLSDKNWLKEQHYVERKTHTKISEDLDVSQSHVSKIMKRHEIETKYYFSSQGERDLNSFIQSMSLETVQNTRSIISPYEIDVFVPSHNIAFEYNGSFWHNTEKRTFDYHLKKTRMCDDLGIRLIHIQEHEWEERQEATKNYIRSALGLFDQTIASSSCQLFQIEPESAIMFFENNHIEGYRPADLTIGLVYDGEMVSAGSFKQLDEHWMMVQTCDACGWSVGGSLHTISQTFKNEIRDVLLYAVDVRREQIQLYQDVGFVIIGSTEPEEVDGIFNCGYELVML